jgi:hypothetical protein
VTDEFDRELERVADLLLVLGHDLRAPGNETSIGAATSSLTVLRRAL